MSYSTLASHIIRTVCDFNRRNDGENPMMLKDGSILHLSARIIYREGDVYVLAFPSGALRRVRQVYFRDYDYWDDDYFIVLRCESDVNERILALIENTPHIRYTIKTTSKQWVEAFAHLHRRVFIMYDDSIAHWRGWNHFPLNISILNF